MWAFIAFHIVLLNSRKFNLRTRVIHFLLFAQNWSHGFLSSACSIEHSMLLVDGQRPIRNFGRDVGQNGRRYLVMWQLNKYFYPIPFTPEQIFYCTIYSRLGQFVNYIINTKYKSLIHSHILSHSRFSHPAAYKVVEMSSNTTKCTIKVIADERINESPILIP